MNLVKEFLLLKAKVDKLYCQLIAKNTDEQDPTVPIHVKNIKQEDINNWNIVKEEEVKITEATSFAQIGQNQKVFNSNVAIAITNQNNIIQVLYGNYSVGTQITLNSNNLYLKDKQGTILAVVAFNINNIEGLSTLLNNKLNKGTYTGGTAQDLKNNIDTKQNKLSSFDESILIETDGNIEGNVSLFTEYFNQQVCELNFIPTQIIGVYKNGIKLLPEEYDITLPKTITIITYSTEKIEIQYTHLKNS